MHIITANSQKGKMAYITHNKFIRGCLFIVFIYNFNKFLPSSNYALLESDSISSPLVRGDPFFSSTVCFFVCLVVH